MHECMLHFFWSILVTIWLWQHLCNIHIVLSRNTIFCMINTRTKIYKKWELLYLMSLMKGYFEILTLIPVKACNHSFVLFFLLCLSSFLPLPAWRQRWGDANRMEGGKEEGSGYRPAQGITSSSLICIHSQTPGIKVCQFICQIPFW